MDAMKKSTVGLVTLLALLCGALLGYVLHTPPKASPAPDAKATAGERKAARRPPTDDAALNRLRKRIQDLERQLAAARSQPTATMEPASAPTNPPPAFARGERRGPPSREEMRAHLEEMRKNDPERYAQMTNRFAKMNSRRLQRTQNRLDLLASVDTSRMSKKQRAVHEQYQDLIARQEELRELLNPQNENVTEAQRRTAMEEMRELHGQMRELAQSERETLLSQTASSFGIEGQDAGELVETVKAVFQATENHGGHGPGGSGGGEPPPPPPGQ